MDFAGATGARAGFVDPVPAIAAVRSNSFFRQSGWMLFAAAASGGIYALVHKCADSMSQESKAEYGAFVALLGVLAQMTVPAIGLQSIFVQETVMADNEERR